MNDALRERIARALYTDVQKGDLTLRGFPFDDAPESYRTVAYRQADAVITAIAPPRHDVESLATVLEELLPERGNDLSTWPEDERDAYREHGWSEGLAAARRLRFEKAARALLAPRVIGA